MPWCNCVKKNACMLITNDGKSEMPSTQHRNIAVCPSNKQLKLLNCDSWWDRNAIYNSNSQYRETILERHPSPSLFRQKKITISLGIITMWSAIMQQFKLSAGQLQKIQMLYSWNSYGFSLDIS